MFYDISEPEQEQESLSQKQEWSRKTVTRLIAGGYCFMHKPFNSKL